MKTSIICLTVVSMIFSRIKQEYTWDDFVDASSCGGGGGGLNNDLKSPERGREHDFFLFSLGPQPLFCCLMCSVDHNIYIFLWIVMMVAYWKPKKPHTKVLWLLFV